LDSIYDQTNGRGVDVAIVATGNLQALQDAIHVVRKGGKVVLFGVPPNNQTLNLDMSKIYSKEVTIIPTYAASDHDTRNALKLLDSPQIDVRQLITHHYPIINAQDAFNHAHDGSDSMKIIVTN